MCDTFYEGILMRCNYRDVFYVHKFVQLLQVVDMSDLLNLHYFHYLFCIPFHHTLYFFLIYINSFLVYFHCNCVTKKHCLVILNCQIFSLIYLICIVIFIFLFLFKLSSFTHQIYMLVFISFVFMPLQINCE